MNYDIILVRYGEMTLKKKNYKQFLQKINTNIKNKCKEFTKIKFSNTDYRFYIYLNGEDWTEIIKKLDTVVGLSSYSLCKHVKDDYDEIASMAIEILKEETNSLGKVSFKVETNRGNKSFPATSLQISQEVAKRILPKVDNLYVDVHNPKLTLNIDLRTEGTYIFIKSIKGLGGYPSGIAGNGLLMMSGGIDSPVAGFLALKKGINITAIHYASPPYTSLNALQKVVDLVEKLCDYTANGHMNLIVVPFTKIQDAIHNNADPKYLVTIMRRAMYKIAHKICLEKSIPIIVNGESIGQVASQTLDSMFVVNDVTNIPIIRPLATYDKEEIIVLARKINTFEISIRPYEDCCTVFVPEHPVIKPNIEDTYMEENKCHLDDLINEACDNVEILNLSIFSKYKVFKNDIDI